MRMTKLKKTKLAIASALLWLSFSGSVFAEEKTMPDGQKFDATYYAETYPDVVSEVGTDENDLYQHYKTYGKGEGRSASLTDQVKNKRLLCTKSTEYDTTKVRHTNLELASSRINGVTLEPGETFSFSDTIGTRTIANGYVSAASIASGKMTTSVGGGICQVSSTLYWGIMESVPDEIEIVERHSHSAAVSYVPKNMDATIAEGTLDFKFKNVGDKTLQIVSTCEDGTVTTSVYEID